MPRDGGRKSIRAELIDTAIETSGSYNVRLCLKRQELCHLNQITGAQTYIDYFTILSRYVEGALIQDSKMSIT